MKENSLNTFQNSLISSQLLQFGNLSIVAYILSFIANLLLIFAVYIAYNRIKSGELKQVLPDYLKRCPYCGRTGPADSIVCAYCGNRFNDFKIY